MTGFTPVAVSNHPMARSKSEAPNIKWSAASFTEINFSFFTENPPGTERFDRNDELIAPPTAPTDRNRSRREIWRPTRITRESFIFYLHVGPLLILAFATICSFGRTRRLPPFG